MISSVVFHAQQESINKIHRFQYDDRCSFRIGDKWTRTDYRGGEVTLFEVKDVRSVEGIRGEEIHVFLLAKGSTHSSFLLLCKALQTNEQV